jgi:hypothetical protein
MLGVLGKAHDREARRFDKVVCTTGRRLRQSRSGCDREIWVYEQVDKLGCDLVKFLYIRVLSCELLFVSIIIAFVYKDSYGC